MFKDSRGYLLIDSIYGFMIILILCTGLIPLFTHIYRERQTIASENRAIELLKQQSIEYKINGIISDNHKKVNSVDYDTYLMTEDQKKSLCVEWTGPHSVHSTVKCLEII